MTRHEKLGLRTYVRTQYTNIHSMLWNLRMYVSPFYSLKLQGLKFLWNHEFSSFMGIIFVDCKSTVLNCRNSRLKFV